MEYIYTCKLFFSFTLLSLDQQPTWRFALSNVKAAFAWHSACARNIPHKFVEPMSTADVTWVYESEVSVLQKSSELRSKTYRKPKFAEVTKGHPNEIYTWTSAWSKDYFIQTFYKHLTVSKMWEKFSSGRHYVIEKKSFENIKQFFFFLPS